jgi:hypothetical protein
MELLMIVVSLVKTNRKINIYVIFKGKELVDWIYQNIQLQQRAEAIQLAHQVSMDTNLKLTSDS